MPIRTKCSSSHKSGKDGGVRTSCNLTTLGCLRSFKVPISLFICNFISQTPIYYELIRLLTTFTFFYTLLITTYERSCSRFLNTAAPNSNLTQGINCFLSTILFDTGKEAKESGNNSYLIIKYLQTAYF